MPKAFDFSSAPFDRLRPQEVERVAHAVDVVFLRQSDTVLRAGDLPDWLYVVIKGVIEERHGTEIVQLHGLSAHADQGELLRWVAALPGPPERIFLNHGEDPPRKALAAALAEAGWARPALPLPEDTVPW